jgi:hypothetical protein
MRLQGERFRISESGFRIGGAGNTAGGRRDRAPGRSHMLRLAEQADVSVCEAKSIIGEGHAAAARWPDFAGRAGVSDATRHRVAGPLSMRGT